jgi:hypothetical protein
MDEILLDTTYLLPIFGVSVGLKDFESGFRRLLGSYSVRYNPVSLTEAKWIVIRLARANPIRRDALFGAFRAGLRALESDDRLKATRLTGDAVEQVADELLTGQGVKDYFDRMVYATAADLGCALLTEDEELLKLRRSEGPRPSAVLTWKKTATV